MSDPVHQPAARGKPAIVLSIDVEDWNQLVHRRLGYAGWDVPHPALRRQLLTLFGLLEEHGASATFFVLGMTGKNHPELVEEIAARGYEVACHGMAHEPVFRQSRDTFRRDVETSCDLLERVCGMRPVGYRAPAFSINRNTTWAFEILAELGISYDSSVYDSPRIPNRIGGIPDEPCRLAVGPERELWEYPIATLEITGVTLPVGGGGYWRLLPRHLLLPALERVRAANPYPVLYLHPYELDPAPLRVEHPGAVTPAQSLRAIYRELWRNIGRRRTATLLRAAARRFQFVSYKEIHDEVIERFGARPRALSASGTIV
jgi:polysaccharide deacetylase family protein (PEP-CTERM system associated)